MEELRKVTGGNGCIFLDNSATVQDIYMIHVTADAVFTVLKEGADKNATGVDLMSTMNLTGKTIPAGAMLTPYAEVFTDVTITSGSAICYKLGK